MVVQIGLTGLPKNSTWSKKSRQETDEQQGHSSSWRNFGRQLNPLAGLESFIQSRLI